MTATASGVFVSWVRHHGRSESLAHALGLSPEFIAVGRGRNPKTAPFRYAAQSVRTAALILGRRPSRIVVMAPPLALPALAFVLRRAYRPRPRVVIDAHSAAVLRADGTVKPQFVALAKRADLVVVTTAELCTRLTDAGLRAVALDDPPPEPARAASADVRPARVVFPASWAPDEPIEELVTAAASMPDVEVVITGAPDKRRLAAVGALPPNVIVTGHLPADAYRAEVATAGAVLALTRRDLTMQRAGYEAMGAARPLVASNTACLRSYFGSGALFVENDAASLADGIRTALGQQHRLAADMGVLAEAKRAQFERAVAALSARL